MTTEVTLDAPYGTGIMQKPYQNPRPEIVGTVVGRGPGVDRFADGAAVDDADALAAEPGKAPPVSRRILFKSRHAIVTPGEQLREILDEYRAKEAQ